MTLWLIGGHDPTHGAGLYRDLVTARQIAPELSRRFVVTALTEQGHGRPARACPVSAHRVHARMTRWPAPRAIKVGLVPDNLVPVVTALIQPMDVPIVVDPVLRASDGGALGATVLGLAPLLAIATLITPNDEESRALVVDQGDRISALGRRFGKSAVLLKGGHGRDPVRVSDHLIQGASVITLTRIRQVGPDPRGTGCALATAIATRLAQGVTLVQAVKHAVAWLDHQRIHWQLGSDGHAHLPDS